MKQREKASKRGWLGVVAAAMILFLGVTPAAQLSEARTADKVAVVDSGSAAQSAASPAAFSLPWTPPSVAYRISVTADGLYALTYTDLATAGLPVDTLDPRSLQLYYMGQPVPIRVIGEEDGYFDAADVVLFYGRSVDSLYLDGVLPTNKYTASNIYWLTYACAAGPCAGPYGARMATVDGSNTGNTPDPFLHQEHLQKSRWYFSAYPFEYDADHWFADWTTQNTATYRTYSFSAFNHAPGALPDSLTLRFLGWGNNPHDLRVWVNDNLVIGSSSGWSGFTFYTTTVDVPRNFFVEGTNRVKVGIDLPAGVGSDMVYLDWWDLLYHDTYVAESDVLDFNNANAGAWRYDVSSFTSPAIEVYDVTDPFGPQRFINTTVSPTAPHTVSFGDTAGGAKRYLAVAPAAWRKPAAIELVTQPASIYRPVDLLAAANSADYILITHRDFWAQAETLAAYRDGDFRVALVDVQQIYDQFNGGMMSAESIRDFLAYAHAHWTAPAPAYVLLMGDGTNDMRKYRTTSNTYIPPYLYLADPDMGETAADNRFVTFIGDDNIPDMHIGRFPVNTIEQAQAMVDKTMRYEVSCQCDGVWDKNTLFVADDLEGGGGNFYAYSDKIADGYVDEPANTLKLIPETYQVQKEYLGLTCNIAGNPTDAAQCRGNLVNTLNAVTNPPGALFVSYVGHSTKETWASEHLFDKPANAQLTNGPCLPIMLAMTCYEGSFHDFETPEVLAEASVRKTTGGAVASFSPTGFGLVTGHDYLEKGMMLAWFHQGIDRLGASMTFAKQYLVNNAPVGRYLDLLDTFVLLGDPALRVKTEAVCLAPTAVLARSFSARQERGGVRIEWQTADESEMLGFNILRSPAGAGSDKFVAVNLQTILAGHSGIANGDSYAYLDGDIDFGQMYQYKLEIVKLDGSREQFGLAESGSMRLYFYLPLVGK
jgi:hypothetical protein